MLRLEKARWQTLPWSYIVSSVITLAVIATVLNFVNFKAIAALDFTVVYQYRYTFLRAIGTTLGITSTAIVIGLIVGIALAVLIIQGPRPVRMIVTAYVEIWRNTPLIVQLFWVHFALPVVTGINSTALQSGLIAMTMQSAAYLTDIARTGILAVPKGQYEASAALGLPGWSKWMDIILPQALRIVIPPLATIAVGFFKASAILSLLSVGELMTQAKNIATYTHKPIEIMTFVGLVYWVMGYSFGSLAYKLEGILGSDQRVRR